MGMLAVGMPSWEESNVSTLQLHYVGLEVSWGENWDTHTSLLPRPKPLITGPRRRSGYGACGVSGPAIGSRGPFGRPTMLI